MTYERLRLKNVDDDIKYAVCAFKVRASDMSNFGTDGIDMLLDCVTATVTLRQQINEARTQPGGRDHQSNARG